MNTEEKLLNETKKWTEKIVKERKNIILLDENKKDFLENIDAYIKDSDFFLKDNDLIRAFEAIIWAWSWLEIGLGMGVLKKSD